MQLTNHPLVRGQHKRSGLFWFTISTMLAETSADMKAGRTLPRYLGQPQVVFDPIWAMPDRTMHSLGDEENSGHV